MKENLFEQLKSMEPHINIDTNISWLVNMTDASKQITEISRKFIHPYSRAYVYNQKEDNIYVMLGIDKIEFVKFLFNINTNTLHKIQPAKIRIPLDWIGYNTEISYLLGETVNIHNYEYDLNQLTKIVKDHYKNIYYKGISSLIKIRATIPDNNWLDKNIESFLELTAMTDKQFFPENSISDVSELRQELDNLYLSNDIYTIDIKIYAANKEYRWKKEFLTSRMTDEYFNKCIEEFYSQPHNPACGTAIVSVVKENYFFKKMNKYINYSLTY